MIPIRGAVVDDETRCAHYGGPTDVVAMRFACCDAYFPCFECHELEGHAAVVWPASRFDEPSVLCGVCRHELTAREYFGAAECPRCTAAFNPGCALHRHLYFEV